MMNFYPSWWNVTLTVYNKFTDTSTDQVTWYKHVVYGAFWKNTGNKIALNDVIVDTNDIICRIRKNPAFLENFEWVDLPAEEKEAHFTLNEGDIIVKGEVADNINEYTSGYRSTDFIQKYKALQGCLVVSKFTINTDGGRCNEHYYVEGE